MAARDPEQRRELARLAAAERWGKVKDRTAATQTARDSFLKALEPSPEEVPDPAQRRSMAEHRLRAHMMRMRLARRRNQQAKPDGQPVTA